MGADIKKIRNRIKSVNSTLHLTKAMGLVASSKIRRATDAMMKSRAYEATVKNITNLLTSSPECAKSPFMQKSEKKKIKFIVIAGDRGMAGGYNANVFRCAAEYENAEFIPIGNRACDRYGFDKISSERFSSNDAAELAKELCDKFKKGEFDALGIICTRYVSMLTQEAYIKWVLPLERNEKAEQSSVIFEPSEAEILEYAVREYVAGLIVSAVRESFASEVAARRNAMDSAGKNAQTMIDDLTLSYNRARQGAITQEITEIVAGSGM